LIDLQAKLSSLPGIENVKAAAGLSSVIADEEMEKNEDEMEKNDEEMEKNDEENEKKSEENNAMASESCTNNKSSAKVVDEDGFMLVQSKRKGKS